MQVYPNKLQTESDNLAEKWYEDDEGLSIEAYFDKYSSKELKRFNEEYRLEKEKAWRLNREIIN